MEYSYSWKLLIPGAVFAVLSVLLFWKRNSLEQYIFMTKIGVELHEIEIGRLKPSPPPSPPPLSPPPSPPPLSPPPPSESPAVFITPRKPTNISQAPVVRQQTMQRPIQIQKIYKERFLIPLVTSYLGINNQLIEYMSAALIARATGRTLCLPPLSRGPLKHQARLWKRTMRHTTIPLESRFNVKDLSKFVKVSSMSRCAKACGKNVDMVWELRDEKRTYDFYGAWSERSDQSETFKLGWSFAKWRSSRDIAQRFEAMNRGSCATISGIFPGLGWRGAFLAVSAFLNPSTCISEAVSDLQIRAFGQGKPFLAVHWRFEEAHCSNQALGLCFLRCGDGSIISSALHFTGSKRAMNCNHSSSSGVIVTKEDILAAILEKAREQNVQSLYLATDGWFRGSKAQALLAAVIEALRMEGINVAGLWNIKGVPNFSDGTYFDPAKLRVAESCKMIGVSQMVSSIEQELCAKAKAFLGSGESTWSLNVFYIRIAKRRASDLIRRTRRQDIHRRIDRNIHDLVIGELLSDQHCSGLSCRYPSFYRQSTGNYSVEELHDEQPDGWLDLEACEKRIPMGSHCRLALCI